MAQLEASIRARGVEDPIYVDEHGVTLDGHHRRAVADRLGMTYETRVVSGLAEEEKALFAIRRNTERRQLSKAQRALVGMRAEPAFRVEAKARQGTRTDLLPDSTKSRSGERRRVWAAEESARLVGLPFGTYRDYRKLIAEARRDYAAGGKDPEDVDRAIESATWDIPELRTLRSEREQRAAVRQHHAKQLQAEQLAERARDAAALAWRIRDVLGRPRQQQVTSDDDAWYCAECDIYWPIGIPACARCSAQRPLSAEVPKGAIWPRGRVPDPPPPAPPIAPDPATVTPAPARQVPAPSRLRPPDREFVRTLSLRSLAWCLPGREEPRELAAVVAEELSPPELALLRENVRTFLGWLASFDVALATVMLRASSTVEHADPAVAADKEDGR
jgi:ParB-like chromosome segregation protein Spo0J